MNRALRILLGQLGANGDCLCATAVARQIKHDFPGCHLTWAVGSCYRAVLEGNRYIDDIWEYPVSSRSQVEPAWSHFAREARERKSRGDFDELFLTQVPPDNYGNFDGTVRVSIFRGYPRPISVPLAPVIRLSSTEVARVTQFVRQTGLASYAHRILLECAATSGQTFLTPEFAVEAAHLLLAQVPDTAVVLSSNIPTGSSDPRLIDGSVLSFRENAELTKHCTLFVGGGSGISWLATSEWAKPLPMIQLLSRRTSVFASMVHDAEYFGLPTDQLLEMTDCSAGHLAGCIAAVFSDGFASARSHFHEQIPVRLDFYLTVFVWSLVRRRRLGDAFRSLQCTLQRYGVAPFLDFGIRMLKKALPTRWQDAHVPGH